MFTDRDTLWLSLRPIFIDSAARVSAIEPTLVHSISSSANESVFLRGYLAFSKHADGDEVAITVDVKIVDDHLTIGSDVSTDSGEIIASGPCLEIPLQDARISPWTAFGDWLRDFERFVRKTEPTIMVVISKFS